MRPFLLVLVLTGFVQSQVVAQEKSDGPVRMLYSAKNLAAGDLHFVLEKHYGGVETVKFLVEKQAGVISIRAANQGALDDVLKTIATLDKTPRSIAFQGVVIDAAAPAEGAAAVELNQAQLTGSADEVLKVARGWVKEGKVARVRTFKWTGMENQVSEDTIGEIAPRVGSARFGPRGEMIPSYTDMNVGTIFSVRPRITEANEIVCELIYNHSEFDPKANVEAKPNGAVEPARIIQGRAQTTINIPSGRSVVVSAREGGAAGAASLVVMSATVVNPNAAPAPTTPPAAPPAAAAAPAEPGRGRGTTVTFSSSVTASSLLLSQFRTEEFAAKVKLTDDQKRKLEDLATERDKMMSDMNAKMRDRGGEFLNDPAARDELVQITAKRQDIDGRAVAVLTAEQKGAFDKFADEYRASRNRARDRAFGEGAGERGLTFGERGAPAPRDRLASINRSLERSPNEPRYLAMRAQVYAADEKWDEAIADYRKVLELDPRNVQAVVGLAALLAYRGDEAGYRKFADQLLERFGNEGSAAEKLWAADACLLRPEWLSNAAVAESMLEAAIKAIPGEAPQPGRRVDLGIGLALSGVNQTTATAEDVVVAKGRLHILRSQPDEAIKILKPFIDEGQANRRRTRQDLEVSAWCSMAIAYLSKGNTEAATSAITQARNLQSDPSSPRVFGGSSLTFDITSKVRLQRAEQILGEAGVKPAASK